MSGCMSEQPNRSMHALGYLLATFVLIVAMGTAARSQAPANAPAPEAWMTATPTSTGIAVGQKIPPFQLRDQSGKLQDFNSIRGPKGAVIQFNRSADW